MEGGTCAPTAGVTSRLRSSPPLTGEQMAQDCAIGLCYDASLDKMKSVLAFVLHLGIALLAVPMVTLISGAALVYPVARHIGFSAATPQQFYSDHLFLLVAITGLWLAYVVCGTFSSRSAVWVWIPAVLALAMRIAMWRSAGSVLFHSSIIEHFVTADCQIQSWHDVGFDARCADKTLLMPLVVGTFGYSAGATIRLIVRLWLRSRRVPS